MKINNMAWSEVFGCQYLRAAPSTVYGRLIASYVKTILAQECGTTCVRFAVALTSPAKVSGKYAENKYSLTK